LKGSEFDCENRTVPDDQKTWEFLLRRYDIERGDDRNERGVFAALVGSLIAVLALTALFLRDGSELSRRVYVAVPAAPLAILALIAYVMQVAQVRATYLSDLEAELARRTGNAIAGSPKGAHWQGRAITAMWLFALGLGLVAIVGVSTVALERTHPWWIQAICGCSYGVVLLLEVGVVLDAQYRRSRIAPRASEATPPQQTGASSPRQAASGPRGRKTRAATMNVADDSAAPPKSAAEPSLRLLLALAAAFVVVFVVGLRCAESHPGAQFQYIAHELAGDERLTVGTGSASGLLSVRGNVQTFTVDSLAGRRDLVISLPLASCTEVSHATGPVKCLSRVPVGQPPITIQWSEPVAMCMALAASSTTLSGQPNFRRNLHVYVALDTKALQRVAGTADCNPNANAGDMCFQTLPSGKRGQPGGQLTITAYGEDSVWFLPRAPVPQRCGPGVKILVEPGEHGRTFAFTVARTDARAIATGSTGDVRAGRAGTTLVPGRRLVLDAIDEIKVKRAHGLCGIVILGKGSPAPVTQSEAVCAAYNPHLQEGVYLASPHVVSAVHVLGALGAGGQQLVQSRYAHDPGMWLALLGIYLTFGLSFVPTLSRRLYLDTRQVYFETLRPRFEKTKSMDRGRHS
jgi:hypothetical protein